MERKSTVREWILTIMRGPGLAVSQSIDEFRRDLINVLVILMVTAFMPMNIFFNIKRFFQNGHPYLIIICLVFYSFAFFHVLRQGKTVFRHGYVWLIYMYSMILFLLTFLGPVGARPAWMVIISLFVLLFYGLRPAIIIITANFFLYFLYYFSAARFLPAWEVTLRGPFREFVFLTVNFTFMSIFSILSVALLLRRLSEALDGEKKAFRDLEEEKLHLAGMNEDLKMEIKRREGEEWARLESEMNYRSLFDSAINGIGIIDLEGNFLDVNRELENQTGRSAAELAGMPALQLIRSFYHGLIVDAIQEVVSGTEVKGDIKIECLRRDGSIFPAQVKGWAIKDSENKLKAIGFYLSDLTKQKELSEEKQKLERQLVQNQKMEAIGTLAGGIAHDFNNIIGGIYGYAELSRDILESDPSTAGKYIDQVLKAAGRARDLVAQILRFSRVEDSELLKIHFIPAVNEVLSLLKSTLPASIELKLDVRTDRDLIEADSTQIHQVLMNLCTNAYHAMKSAGGTLTITVDLKKIREETPTRIRTISPGAYLQVSIKDSGTGIPASIIDRIFEPYFTTKDKNEGTGLGLAVTMGIVRNHKGGLDLQSVEGSGTEFILYFPLISDEKDTADTVQITLPGGRGENVCIVDDEENLLELMTWYLEKNGYRVLAFSSSLQARERILSDPYSIDLIVTDQNMPGLMGIDLVKSIRKGIDNPPPIIMATGFSDTVNEMNFREHGIAALIMKPTNKQDFLNTVHRMLARIHE